LNSSPTHTPYDGSATPFTIGLKPLDLADWIEVDGKLPAYLEEKERHYAAHPERVFAAEPGTEKAASEVLELLAAHLTTRFPELYAREGDRILISGPKRSIDLADSTQHPLKMASLLVQEDLVLMRKGEDGWRLAAASLCFPSSWSLREKFGRPLPEVHRPVPGLGRGTRMETLIERIFDNMKVGQPVQRMNWSLQENDELHRPLSHNARVDRADRGGERANADQIFIRVERQTLRKLPRSGDILFTIRIHADPVAALASHPDRAAIAASFAAQLESLDAAQAGYKGLAAMRGPMVAALKTLAAS
jgi:hypothetical protein